MITVKDLILKSKELEDSLFDVYPIDKTFYNEVLQDYSIQIYALKHIGNSYPLEHAIDIEEQKSDIEIDPTPEDFDRLTVMLDILGVLYAEI